MSDTGPSAPPTWEQEGQRLAPLLDDVYATVVAGSDSGIAASIAIGIARVQGTRRRVAIADLIGESLPLEALLTGDDPHGISDSFLYGVSLNKIARPVGEAGQVFVMPSGTEPVANEAVYANERWRRLAAGFHQVGALLLVVAVPGTPGFAELCAFVGAVMPVGDAAFPLPPGVRVVAPLKPAAEAALMPTPSRASTARARAIAAENSATRNRRLLAGLLVLAAIGFIVGTTWPQWGPRLLGTQRADSTRLAAPPAQVVQPDSARDTLRAALDSAAQASVDSAAAAALVPLEPINPADSLRSARFAVYFAMANTREDAMPASAPVLPAVALSPVSDSAEQWFRVTVGATNSRRVADSMLAALRARKVIGAGSIVSVPFALQLEDSVEAGAVAPKLADYAKRGLVAYALRQRNGRATILTGAFESPKQASTLADSLQKIGIVPVLVYRTGRAF